MMAAAQVYESILRAARRQIATTPEGAAIASAGLAGELWSLLEKIAGNAANPIADAAEDAALALAAGAGASSPGPGPIQGEGQVGDEGDCVRRQEEWPQDAGDRAGQP